MPWAIFNRPSIQLGSLKAYLDQHSSCHTELFHPYLQVAVNIGSEHYHHLALNSWAGEALYAPLLFPEQQERAEALFYEEIKGNPALNKLHFESCLKALDTSLDQWLATLDLGKYTLFGFSVCFNQLLSTLTAASRLKKLQPSLPIVIGGSACVGEIGASLLETFPQLDYVINGEGEEALLELVTAITTEQEPSTLSSAIVFRGRETCHSCARGISDLDNLPIPDYTPYFLEMQRAFPASNFIPVLPIEFSRGCWWNKCTFCNLNLQWKGYRTKSAQKVLHEVQYQAKQYQCLDFCFTDNALPPKGCDEFFEGIHNTKQDYDFFAEVRVITTPDTLPRYRKGGLSSIQVGIEALSTTLLTKMRKGTRCIENIAAMRHSAEAGITLDGNLICEFPGTSEREVEETLHNLGYVLPFTPLSSATFFLGHGSPVAADPQAYGITAITHHKKFKKLLPPAMLSNLTLIVKGYRGDKTVQQKLWRPVYTKIKEWQDFHAERSSSQPPLSYRDGGDFLLIRQEQIGAPPLRHRLKGTSKTIYLFCQSIRSLDAIQAQFPHINKEMLRSFLQDLTNKKLLFTEDDLFLALAIKA